MSSAFWPWSGTISYSAPPENQSSLPPSPSDETRKSTSSARIPFPMLGAVNLFDGVSKHAGITIGSLIPIPFSKYSAVTNSGRILANVSGWNVMVPSLIGLM